MPDHLSAGITCFEVEGMTRAERGRLPARECKIVASISPCATIYARLAPSLLALPQDVETALRAVRNLAA